MSLGMNMGFLLLILRFWGNGTFLQKLREKLEEQTGPLYQIILSWLNIAQQKLITAGYESEVNKAQQIFARGQRAVDVFVNDTPTGGSAAPVVAPEPEIRYVEVKVEVPGPPVAASEPQIIEKVVVDDSGADEIRRNILLIQAVLRYWFGQSTPDRAYNELWNSDELDEERRENIQEEIVDNFADLLNELVAFRWKAWCQDKDMQIYGYQGKLAAIVVLDQFSRIMREYNEEMDAGLTLPTQGECDSMSFQTANLMVIQHTREVRSGMIPIPMYIYALLPYRHANEKCTVEFLSTQAEAIEDFLGQCGTMADRFRRFAADRTSALMAEGTIRDDYDEEDLLGHFPFEADMTVAHEHPVFMAVMEFLHERGLDPNADSSKATPIVVSLSGGVDSMVVAAILSHLVKTLNFSMELHAVHVDNADRPQSRAAAAYIKTYAEELGYTFHGHRIDDVIRENLTDEEFDALAAETRIKVCKDVVEELRKNSGDMGLVLGRVEIGIIFGQHRGDIREALLTNAHTGSGPLDLSGMTPVSEFDGVLFYRPMLNVEQELIYEYAHAYGIAYLKETTMNYSMKGKLRNKLLPLIEEVFGEQSLDNLTNLAIESDECRSLLHNVTLGPFLDQVAHKPMGVAFRTSLWADQGTFFWKYVLREVLTSAKLDMMPDESLTEFLECIRADKIQEGWLNCSDEYAVYLRSDGQVYIFKPEAFPWQEGGFKNAGQQVYYGKEKAVATGPWKVTAFMLGQLNAVLSQNEIKSRLEKKAVHSMDSLMEGKIDYYMEVPTWQALDGSFEARPLIFTPFNDASRPKAWKSVDTKIQEILPLVNNDEMAFQALRNPVGWGTMHTNDQGKEVQNPILLVQVTVQIEN